MSVIQYDKILAILCSVLDAYSAVLFLQDKETGSYYIASSFSLGNKVDFSVNVEEGRGLVGWIIRNKQPLLVANFDRHQNYLGYYKDNEELTIKAFMGCALPNDFGVLCIDSKRQYSFSEKDQKMLYLFTDFLTHIYVANQENSKNAVTSAFSSALQSIYELRHRSNKWSDFLTHFLDIMVAATGFSYSTLCTRDSNGEGYIVEAENYELLSKLGDDNTYHINSGIIGWVFRNGKEVISSDFEREPEIFLTGKKSSGYQFSTIFAVPFIIQRKTRCVLCLCSEEPIVVSSSLKSFVEMSCEYVTLFLENLFLKSRLREIHLQAKKD